MEGGPTGYPWLCHIWQNTGYLKETMGNGLKLAINVPRH